MTVEIQDEWYSLKQCSENRNKLFVFGDNTIGIGEAGQASIRTAENSIGLATKILPSNSPDAYFQDNEKCQQIVMDELDKIILICESGKYDTIVFPSDGLGTGLSMMPKKAPELFKWMNAQISKTFNIPYTF